MNRCIFPASCLRITSMPSHLPLYRKQRGVALFLALILLLVMTLLGLAVVQVTTLQERMASSYRAENRAQQHADANIADYEFLIAEAVNSGIVNPTTLPVTIKQDCSGFDSQEFVAGVEAGVDQDDEVTTDVRRVDTCSVMPGFASKKMGQKQNENTNVAYQITTSGLDTETGEEDQSVSVAVAQTIFIP